MPMLEGEAMKRSQIRIGDELMLGNGLVEVVGMSRRSVNNPCNIAVTAKCGTLPWLIECRPEDLSRPVKIRETKLQRDALKAARWWVDDQEQGDPPLPYLRMDEIDLKPREALQACGVWGSEAYASAILSEVM